MKIKKNTDQRIISWSDTKFSDPKSEELLAQTLRRISNENMGEKGFKNEGAGK